MKGRLWTGRVHLPLLLGTLVVLGCGSQRNGSDETTRAAQEAQGEAPWFVEVTTLAGIDFVHESGATGELHAPEIMGSGVALLDLDGDSDLDLYLVNAAFELGQGVPSESPDSGTPASRPTNRFYRQAADGRFVDDTETSGLGDPGYGMGVAAGDYDNDGDVDLYLTNLGGDRLYRNRGDGRFDDATVEAGIQVDGWSTSAAFCDLDRDGYLDLYVVRYVRFDSKLPCSDGTGRPEYCGPESFEDEPDVLLHNNGDGTFTDRSTAAGIGAVTGAGLGLVCEDLNRDGWLDVYVANDADPNQLWINQRDGTWRDEALVRGAGVNAQGLAEAGMGVVAADFDNDLDPDLFMTHLKDESNTLYRNLGGELGFEDQTAAAGLRGSSMTFTGFGTAALDADHDGDLDLLVANGRVKRGESVAGKLPEPWGQYAEPNLAYRNRGEGVFELVAEGVAGISQHLEVTRGLASGDIDGDGDLDLVLTNTQGPARLYKNQLQAAGHWLLVEAVDPRLRRLALGSTVTVHLADRKLMRTVSGAWSYLSASDPRAHFGLGEWSRVEGFTVAWVDGAEETFPGVEADQVIRLVRGQGESAK